MVRCSKARDRGPSALAHPALAADGSLKKSTLVAAYTPSDSGGVSNQPYAAVKGLPLFPPKKASLALLGPVMAA